MEAGTIIAVCVSKRKGTPKTEVDSCFVQEGHGLEGDAHGGDWHRQVSLLAIEDIQTMADKGLDVKPGSFAENLTVQGFDLGSVKIGDRMKVGESVVLEVTQIGKECHTRCAIYHKVGDCVMPDKGIFCKIIQGGPVNKGDAISMA